MLQSWEQLCYDLNLMHRVLRRDLYPESEGEGGQYPESECPRLVLQRRQENCRNGGGNLVGASGEKESRELVVAMNSAEKPSREPEKGLDSHRS